MRVKVTLGYTGILDGYNKKTVIALTLSEWNMNNIRSRGGTMSNKIKLSKTANNKLVLSQLDDNKSVSETPYKLHRCKIEVEGSPIFYGVAEIVESGDYFNLRIFSDLADFFSTIGDMSINEIDLESYDHAYTSSQVYLRKKDDTYGVIYPNINYGRWTGQEYADVPHTDFFPAVYLRTLLVEVASQNGSYELLNYYPSRYIPFSKRQFAINNSAKGVIATDTGSKYLWKGTGWTPADTYATFNNTVGDSRNNLIKQDASTGTYIDVPRYSTLKLKCTAYYYAPATNPRDVTFAFGSKTNTDNRVSQVVAAGESGIFEAELTFETSDVADKAYLYLQTASVIATVEELYFNSVVITDPDKKIEMEIVDASLRIRDGDNVAVEDTLPDISVKDLFIDEAVRQNAIIQVDNEKKTIEFIKLDDIAKKWPIADDWSNKVDLSEEPIYEFCPSKSDYGQTSIIKFEDGIDEDPLYYINNALGIGYIYISNEALDAEKEMYVSPFSATGETASFEDYVPNIPLIPRYSDPSLEHYEADIDPKPRVLDIILDDKANVFVDGESTTATDQMNGYARSWQYHIDENYTAFKSMMDKYKHVEVLVKLTTRDIDNIDFTKPKYLLGNYWFLTEVEQFKVNKKVSTLCKLTRI